MKSPMFASLDGLADLGSRSGVDMRPTLLRVLTDLYVQKPIHTPDEDRHYTELALRLIEAVDVLSRVAVAERLALHAAPPAMVVARLTRDLPEIAEPLRRHASRPAQQARAVERPAPANKTTERPLPATDTAPDTAHESNDASAATAEAAAGVGIAGELNELFLSADAGERRLILLNLEVLTPVASSHTPVSRDPHACQRLEAAALAHDVEQFVQHLARTLHIAREQALRIVHDELGEPVVVAAKVLKMPPDVLQRILLFLNPTIGQSVARVHALAELYDEITLPASEHLLAIWQALHRPARPAGGHRALLWNDEAHQRARETSAAQRVVPRGQAAVERRSAS